MGHLLLVDGQPPCEALRQESRMGDSHEYNDDRPESGSVLQKTRGAKLGWVKETTFNKAVHPNRNNKHHDQHQQAGCPAIGIVAKDEVSEEDNGPMTEIERIGNRPHPD